MEEIKQKESELVAHNLDFSKDPRLVGAWAIFGDRLVYATKDENGGFEPCSASLDAAFSIDPIAFPLMRAIIRLNPNANSIKVYQILRDMNDGKGPRQFIVDLQMMLTDNYDEKFVKLVVASNSHFVATVGISSKNEDYIKVHIWDLDKIL